MTEVPTPAIHVQPFFGRWEESMDAFSPDPEVRSGAHSFVQGDIQDEPQLYLGLVLGKAEREILVGVATAVENEEEEHPQVRMVLGKIAQLLVIAEREYVQRLQERAKEDMPTVGS
jgi:hypothetical protein